MNIERQENGFVYRGREERCHIARGEHESTGQLLAGRLAAVMRVAAWDRGDSDWHKLLCPGCYMEAVFYMAIELAKANGQSLTELGNTMSAGFAELAKGKTQTFLPVILDSET